MKELLAVVVALLLLVGLIAAVLGEEILTKVKGTGEATPVIIVAALIGLGVLGAIRMMGR